MKKEERRKILTLYFLQGLRATLREDPSVEVINVQVHLLENPNFSKASTFTINFFKKEK